MTEFMTIQQVAESYQLSSSTVRRMIQRGQLTAHRLGPRVIRVRREDLESALVSMTTNESGDTNVQ